jgi:hypothetical protein
MIWLVAGSTSARAACEFEDPENEAANRACLARLCDRDEDGNPLSPDARKECVAAVRKNWRIVAPCQSLPGVDPTACIRNAHLAHSVEEAVDRASSQQNLILALAMLDCAKSGDPLGCLGPPRLTPQPKPDPYFVAVLRGMDPKARQLLYSRLREIAAVQLQTELSVLEQALKAAQ